MAAKVDIHTLHAELIHVARDIYFQIAYTNGGPATITDLGQKNVQGALEAYFSKAGLPIHNEIPGGTKNSVNLLFTTAFEFIPGTLEVWLSGLKLNGKQTDPDRDYDEFVTANGFLLILDPNNPSKLNKAPKQFESLTVNYKKRMTFNTKGGT